MGPAPSMSRSLNSRTLTSKMVSQGDGTLAPPDARVPAQTGFSLMTADDAESARGAMACGPAAARGRRSRSASTLIASCSTNPLRAKIHHLERTLPSAATASTTSPVSRTKASEDV